MIMGIKWVHDNIVHFGGNPDNVTIAGESAGGTAVTTLMAVPSVEGYFQKVIAESSLCELVDTVESQRRKVDLFLEGIGWDKDDMGLLEKLKNTDDYELIKGHLYQESHAQHRHPGILGAGPVIDDLLPKRPIDAVGAGASANVKLIIGTNLNEGTMFVRPEETTFPNSWDMIEECLNQNGISKQFGDFKKLYSDFEKEEKYGSAFVKFATDTGWEVPSIRFATAHSKWNDTYMYRFEYLSGFAKKTGMLVSHAFELPCVFAVCNHDFAKTFFEGESDNDINGIIDAVHTSWVDFVKTGTLDACKWKAFRGGISPVMIFDHNSRVENIDRTKLMELWKDTVFYK
jgi:para-nitrobenzyl esterase